MLLFALAHIIFTNKVILHNQELRKRINSQPWFGVQLLLHPVIVGMTVYLANITGNEWWALVGIPFVFNFGAEPMDLSKLPPLVFIICQTFGYIHHAGPLLACLTCFSIQDDAQFALANALLYAHAWSLHTLGSLDYKKVLDKQKMFYPYIIQGMLVAYYWFSSIKQGLDDEVRFATVLPLLVGPMFQFIGRWCLYWYIRHFLGYPQAGDEHHDAFETNKQLGEIITFSVAAAAVFV